MKKTVRELVQMYDSGKLHTDMSTQRRFIYNDMETQNADGTISKAGDVIKSILERNITLPALFFWNVQDDVKGIHMAEDEFNIHDGKQRFLSIYNFLIGNVTTMLSDKEGVVHQYSSKDCLAECIEKLLNYEFEIVVRVGTEREEEQSFFYINSNGVPLTSYESLKGAYHGKYFDGFEAYLTNQSRTLDSIRSIGRGEQAIWLLFLALGLFSNNGNVEMKPKKREVYVDMAKDMLEGCRKIPFTATP